jgi:hypothetical protein
MGFLQLIASLVALESGGRFCRCRWEAADQDARVLFALALVLVITLPFLLWLFGIRRYCVSNGKGYTPGANWGVTVWIDWQEASEMAAARGDAGMRRFCNVFLAIQLIYKVIGLLALIGGLLTGKAW